MHRVVEQQLKSMEGQDMKSITVLIGSRPYPLKVKAEDEAAIRKVVREINEKINHFQLTYTGKDKQDCMAMALLTYAVELYKCKQTAAPDTELSSKLAQLDELLDSLIE